MSEESIVDTVNINGELGINGDKWMMENIRSGPHTITESGTRVFSMYWSGAETDGASVLGASLEFMFKRLTEEAM